MKKLKDYSEDTYKCTKCGLCQSVCPVYEQTGLESAVSRGKFAVLNGVINGELEFTKRISSYLDLCLHCNACSDYCPSGIEAEEIITAAKHEAFKKGYTKILKKLTVMVFGSKFLLNIIKKGLFVYRKMNLSLIADFLSKPARWPGAPWIGTKIGLFNEWTKVNIEYKKLPVFKNNKVSVVYFPGCINSYINPSVKNAVKMVLETNGVSVQIPNFDCCGIPARNAGDFDSFIEFAKSNLDKIPDDAEYIITDCASCGTVWYLYAQMLEGHYKEKAYEFSQKTININTLLNKLDLFIPDSYSGEKQTVTYHDPCHLVRFQNVKEDPREVLKQLPNVEFVEMKDADKCCGAAGNFFVCQEKLSKSISQQKAKNIINTNAQIVSTSCPSCNIGIIQGLIEENQQLKVYQPVELLAELYLKTTNF